MAKFEGVHFFNQENGINAERVQSAAETVRGNTAYARQWGRGGDSAVAALAPGAMLAINH